jgi:hypothetical protein
MSAKSIRELQFAQFGEIISPMPCISVAKGMRTPRDKAAWYAERWDSKVRRGVYSFDRLEAVVARDFPLAGHRFEFEDIEISGATAALGLDPASSADNSKVAGLLATRNVWLAALEHHCRQRTDGEPENLSAEVANDFVLLSCKWTAHPWVLDVVQKYREEKAREAEARPAAPIEYSSHPGWPSAQVISVRPPVLTPDEQTVMWEEQAAIGYWIRRFESENRNWSSEFAVAAWDAESDINVANRKIQELQGLMEAQQEHIHYLTGILRESKRRDAQLDSRYGKAGRPKMSPERQGIAQKFTVAWVASLKNLLAVKSYARMEEMVSGTSQRNWRRWGSGEAVPTLTTLADIQTAKVARGRYKGQSLKDLATTPAYDELVKLVRVMGMAAGIEG